MKYFVGYAVLVACVFGALLRPSPLSSANLTSVKDTLQSSRLSVSASAPANTISTAPLRAQDSLTIGTGTYTVVDIYDTDEFDVTPVLASGDADDNDVIYLKAKPRHAVQFTSVSAVANGFFQVLLPAVAQP